MRIIADENIPLVEEFFAHLGEIIRLPGRGMRPEDLKGADALLVRSVTQVDESLLRDSQVKFVGTCTIGVDHLDQKYLDQAGIGWASAPGCNANSVVEYVYAALAHLDVDWSGRRVGIIGCGNVGGFLHRRLRAQGVECRCYDPFLTLEDNPDLTDLDAVLDCDIVCLHTPLTTDGPHPSRHLLSDAELARLRPGTVLLNAGRGPVIDNAALLRRLEAAVDLQVVLDVWEPEPDISRELLAKVSLGTPHIAGYSYDGKITGTAMIYNALCQQLGIEPERNLEQLLPPVAQNRLRVSAKDGWLAQRALIPQIYAIAEDDRRLRELAQRAEQGQEDFAKGFDRLRKQYPIRREFGNYQLEFESGAEASAERLAALGFKV
ncbi:4-phosphoerythronate dehydrogenase [Marinimicrobium sp. ABcell2]|uniref:4-phosphoerythronate dehydrogenase n=1 Tax=Marinimicrobium sp. ABcell2 TaxID=3069751 RepID=UPI0027B809D6|nr:4-phosphoerythronate dehydrogenase [Marinimicrobium sp. ABcell2]MDQ2075246.1 4-phosphoerythronate dehydrogenase [Marinimicrobium sp. ABcell2]